VRKITDLDSGEVTYTHTFKDGKGISREEIEYFISEGLYNQMIEAVKTIPLVKERTTGGWNHNIKIDVYTQLELSVLEVESIRRERKLTQNGSARMSVWNSSIITKKSGRAPE
jgi:hypothetical protein